MHDDSGIFVALGSNLPATGCRSPQETLDRAIGALTECGRVEQVSSWWCSPAWPPAGTGETPQPDFVNGVARISTDLPTAALLEQLLMIERRFGRVRPAGQKWAARSLDLDLLDYRGSVLASPELELPHPRLADRLFVLLPLQEIAPDWRHPVSRLGVADLIERAFPMKIRRLAAYNPQSSGNLPQNDLANIGKKD